MQKKTPAIAAGVSEQQVETNQRLRSSFSSARLFVLRVVVPTDAEGVSLARGTLGDIRICARSKASRVAAFMSDLSERVVPRALSQPRPRSDSTSSNFRP